MNQHGDFSNNVMLVNSGANNGKHHLKKWQKMAKMANVFFKKWQKWRTSSQQKGYQPPLTIGKHETSQVLWSDSDSARCQSPNFFLQKKTKKSRWWFQIDFSDVLVVIFEVPVLLIFRSRWWQLKYFFLFSHRKLGFHDPI